MGLPGSPASRGGSESGQLDSGDREWGVSPLRGPFLAQGLVGPGLGRQDSVEAPLPPPPLGGMSLRGCPAGRDNPGFGEAVRGGLGDFPTALHKGAASCSTTKGSQPFRAWRLVGEQRPAQPTWPPPSRACVHRGGPCPRATEGPEAPRAGHLGAVWYSDLGQLLALSLLARGWHSSGSLTHPGCPEEGPWGGGTLSIPAAVLGTEAAIGLPAPPVLASQALAGMPPGCQARAVLTPIYFMPRPSPSCYRVQVTGRVWWGRGLGKAS